jgi:hypothetical protein
MFVLLLPAQLKLLHFSLGPPCKLGEVIIAVAIEPIELPLPKLLLLLIFLILLILLLDRRGESDFARS